MDYRAEGVVSTRDHEQNTTEETKTNKRQIRSESQTREGTLLR